MFQSLIEAVRRETSGERALETVKALARFHRVQASPGYDEASDWMAGEIESRGLKVEVRRVPGDGRTRLLGQLMPRGWSCARASAVLHDGRESQRLGDYAAQKLSLILRSAPARGRFGIVAVESGTEPEHYQGVDVRGRIVLTDGDVHRVHRLAVIERGAAGLIAYGRRLVPPARDAFTDPDALAYTSFWWGEDEPRGWGFVIGPREAARLRERLRAGAPLELEVEIESRDFETSIPLLSAVLPGTAGKSATRPGEILIVSHLCHPQPSANDNASGAAANLETARVLKQLRDRGEWAAPRDVRFLWVPELTGTYAWLAVKAQEKDAARIDAALNLDMVGEDQDACGSTFLIEHPPCMSGSFAEVLLSRIRAQASDWVRSYSGPGLYSMTRMAEVPYAGGSDHAVFVDSAIGVPCPMLIQWPDRYYHSSYDTPDRCDPRSLALAVRCAATYAGFLAAAGEAEQRWLLRQVALSARHRLLKTLETEAPARAAEAERLRGHRALESVARLSWRGPSADAALERALEAEREALETFHHREVAPHAGRTDDPAAGDGDGGLRPVRRLRAPLHHQRRLIEGFARLQTDACERWRMLETPPQDLALAFDLAWSACDGTRSLKDIGRLVWLETGRHADEEIHSFFEWTAALGLSQWSSRTEEACRSSAPGTVSP